jgi:DNA-binding NtrC family response regulator
MKRCWLSTWPGNVRELQNEVMRALALGEGAALGAELLSPRLRVATAKWPAPADTARRRR